MKNKGNRKVFVLIMTVAFALSAVGFVIGSNLFYMQQYQTKVTLVNEDIATNFLSKEINFGQQVMKIIERDNTYNWNVAQRFEALRQIENNETDVVVIIPHDFSEKAVAINKIKPEKIQLLYMMNPTQNQLQMAQSQRFVDTMRTLLSKNIQEVYFASVLQNLDYVKEKVNTIQQVDAEQQQQLTKKFQPNILAMNEQISAIVTADQGEVQSLKGLSQLLQEQQQEQETLAAAVAQYEQRYANFKENWVANNQNDITNHQLFTDFSQQVTRVQQKEVLHQLEQQMTQIIDTQEITLHALEYTQTEMMKTSETLYQNQQILNTIYQRQDTNNETGGIAEYFSTLFNQLGFDEGMTDSIDIDENTLSLEKVELQLEEKLQTYCQENTNFKGGNIEKTAAICSALLHVPTDFKTINNPHFNVQKLFLIQPYDKAKITLEIDSTQIQLDTLYSTLQKVGVIQEQIMEGNVPTDDIVVDVNTDTGKTNIQAIFENTSEKSIILAFSSQFDIQNSQEQIAVRGILDTYTESFSEPFLHTTMNTPRITGVAKPNSTITLCLFDTKKHDIANATCDKAVSQAQAITNEYGYFETAFKNETKKQPVAISLKAQHFISTIQSQNVTDNNGEIQTINSDTYFVHVDDTQPVIIPPVSTATERTIITQTVSDDITQFFPQEQAMHAATNEAVLQKMFTLYYGYDIDTLYQFIQLHKNDQNIKATLIDELQQKNRNDALILQLHTHTEDAQNFAQTLIRFKADIITNIEALQTANKQLLTLYTGEGCQQSSELQSCSRGLNATLTEQIAAIRALKDEVYQPLLMEITNFKTDFAHLQEEMTNIQLAFDEYIEDRSKENDALEDIEIQQANLLEKSDWLNQRTNISAERVLAMADATTKMTAQTQQMKDMLGDHQEQYNQLATNFIQKVEDNRMLSDELSGFFTNSKVNGVENSGLYNFLAEPVLQKTLQNEMQSQGNLLPYYMIVMSIIIAIFTVYCLLQRQQQYQNETGTVQTKDFLLWSSKKIMLESSIIFVIALVVAIGSTYFLTLDLQQTIQWGIIVLLILSCLTQLYYVLIKAFRTGGVFLVLGIFMAYLLTNAVLGVSLPMTTIWGKVLSLNPLLYFEHVLKYIFYNVANIPLQTTILWMMMSFFLLVFLQINIDYFRAKQTMVKKLKQLEIR